MKFTCNSNDLQKSVAIVEKAVSSRSSLPILENVYMELKDNTLKLRGNDLEIGIENSIPIETSQQEGAVLLKAKTFSSIISKLQDQPLEIELQDNNAVILKGNKVDFDILGTEINEYPVFPEIEAGIQLTLTVDDLRDLVSHTVFSVSFDETKQFLNGILIKNDQDKLLFVATDGYRLAFKTQSIVPLTSNINIIVPYKAVNELNRILQAEDGQKQVSITISEKQISFKMESFLLISRVIQGQFPDYNQVIPKESSQKYTVSRKDLLQAAERASIIASASNNVVRLYFENEKLTLKANAAGLGEFKEELDIKQTSGEPQSKIAFNIRLILDVLKTLVIDEVEISFNNEISPCKVVPVGDDSFLYIIMPIRTSDYQESPE